MSTHEASAACLACGGSLGYWRSVPSSEPAEAGARYELLRCARCGTAVTSGTPPLEPHDSGAYRAGDPRLYRLALPALRRFDRRRLTLLSPAPSRLLDVGAGRGRFVASARAAGYDASGLEPSARGAAAAQAAGIPVLRAGVQDAQIAPGSIDQITVWHVLEHLDDPAAALERVGSWLVPGGRLVVGVPNLASLQARLAGDRWYHLDVPRHRVHFTPAGIESLLRSAGFVPVRVEHQLLEHNPFGMWQSLVNRLTRNPSYLYNLLKRNAPACSRDLATTVLMLPLAPLAAIAESVAGAAGRAGTIAVIALRDH